MVCLSGKGRKTPVADCKVNQLGCQKKRKATPMLSSHLFLFSACLMKRHFTAERAKRSHGASGTGNQLVKKLPLVYIEALAFTAGRFYRKSGALTAASSQCRVPKPRVAATPRFILSLRREILRHT